MNIHRRSLKSFGPPAPPPYNGPIQGPLPSLVTVVQTVYAFVGHPYKKLGPVGQPLKVTQATRFDQVHISDPW